MLLKDMTAEQMAAHFAVGGPGVPKVYLSAADFERGVPLPMLLHAVGLAHSRNDARRLIKQGGVHIDGTKIWNADKIVTTNDFTDGLLLIRIGKNRCKRIVLG